jgi:hypothetical protein
LVVAAKDGILKKIEICLDSCQNNRLEKTPFHFEILAGHSLLGLLFITLIKK